MPPNVAPGRDAMKRLGSIGARHVASLGGTRPETDLRIPERGFSSGRHWQHWPTSGRRWWSQ